MMLPSKLWRETMGLDCAKIMKPAHLLDRGELEKLLRLLEKLNVKK
jgi:hypothetical protein